MPHIPIVGRDSHHIISYKENRPEVVNDLQVSENSVQIDKDKNS